ncbi:MAG: sulfonate ABC transporter substrate-binding protein [Pseudomonadota bacterium]
MTYKNYSLFKKMLSSIILALTSISINNVVFAESVEPLRIGFQKYGTLVLLKGQGTLDKRLSAKGVAVKWTEFPAGPQLLEGLNVGSIDFGTVGEAPPIFAQAAGADLVYLSNEPAAPKGEAIIVPKLSVIKSVKDLKGKKVALNKGSNVHYLLVKALEKEGLKYSDIETIFLPPADARAAFERGSVDAWVIWDPFYAAAEHQLEARKLVDGQGIVSNHQFFLASRSYAEKHPDIIKIIHEELSKTDAWGKVHPKEVANLLSKQVGINEPIITTAVNRLTFGVQPISNEVLVEQQKIADVFTNLKLIPKAIQVKDSTLKKIKPNN